MTSHFHLDPIESSACWQRTRLPGFIIAAICVAHLSSPVWGQTNTFPASGSVGIGTLSPASNLQVVGTSTQTNATFGATGAGDFDVLGLTTPNGQGYADLGSNLYYNGSAWNLRNLANDGWLTAMNNNPAGTSPQSTWGVYHVAYNASPATLKPFFSITPSGNVGIGTTTPQHLLGVAGTIGAYEVVVASSGADYVFDPAYRLQPLSEVAEYVKENHHLPEIPSAAEVKENGVSLGEMQSKLLAKVEELTLHMIQSEERNDRLEQQNRDLQTRIERLESQR
jgi:hypothetical protein